MPIETNSRKIADRLRSEGWVKRGGGEHTKYTHPNRRGAVITVPRHAGITKVRGAHVLNLLATLGFGFYHLVKALRD